MTYFLRGGRIFDAAGKSRDVAAELQWEMHANTFSGVVFSEAHECDDGDVGAGAGAGVSAGGDGGAGTVLQFVVSEIFVVSPGDSGVCDVPGEP
jgi:hypothetical protein